MLFIKQHGFRKKQIQYEVVVDCVNLFAKTVCKEKKVPHTPLLATNVSITYHYSFIDMIHVIYTGNYFISKPYPKGT